MASFDLPFERLSCRHNGDLRFYDASKISHVGFRSPSTIVDSLLYKLPIWKPKVDGQLLSCDRFGNMAWMEPPTKLDGQLFYGTSTGQLLWLLPPQVDGWVLSSS